MFKNFFPNKILLLKNKTINNLIVLLLIILAIGFLYSIFLSPPDYVQGESVRIMYVHVPSSFIAISSFALIGIASFLNLVFNPSFFRVTFDAMSVPTNIID